MEGEYYMSSEFVAHTSPVNALLVLGDGTIGKKHKCLKNIGPVHDKNCIDFSH